MMEELQYTLPIYWASYIINGDPTSLADGEQEEIDEYVKSIGSPSFTDISDDKWFAYSNDATTIGGEVCIYYTTSN